MTTRLTQRSRSNSSRRSRFDDKKLNESLNGVRRRRRRSSRRNSLASAGFDEIDDKVTMSNLETINNTHDNNNNLRKRRLSRNSLVKNSGNKRKRRASRTNAIEVTDEDEEEDTPGSEDEVEESNTPTNKRPKIRQRNVNGNEITKKSVILITSSDEEDDGIDDEDVNDEMGATQIIDSTINKKENISRSFNFYECPICFESPGKTIALPCGHCYCFDCLFQAFSHSRTARKTDAVCALCRSSYTLRQVVTLKFKVK